MKLTNCKIKILFVNKISVIGTAKTNVSTQSKNYVCSFMSQGQVASFLELPFDP